jgi:hypothetical protein
MLAQWNRGRIVNYHGRGRKKTAKIAALTRAVGAHLADLNVIRLFSTIPEWRAVDSPIDAAGVLALGATMLFEGGFAPEIDEQHRNLENGNGV